MRRLAVSLLLGAACGGPPPVHDVHEAPPPLDPAPPRPRLAPAAVLTPTTVCDRIFELRAADCRAVAGYELDHDGCVADMKRWFDERGVEAHDAIVRTGRCLLDQPSCDEVASCMAALSPPAEHTFRACADHDVDAPVGLPAAAWAQRKGVGARHFSEAPSTKAAPIEVCGIDAQLTWLMAVTCDDGSRPFANGSAAHAARHGNVGPGGRCGAIVDLYEVPCPEASYDVFMDAYVCPLP
jgi:hypothetical protein